MELQDFPIGPNHVGAFASVDIETLGKRTDSPIIEIGVSVFTGTESKFPAFWSASEFIVPDWSRADPETLAWWKTQDHWETIKDLAECGRHSVNEAMKRLVLEFERSWGISLENDKMPWYALGPHFDIAMLDYQGDMPWTYRQPRDLRTVLDTLNGGNRPPVRMNDDIQHSALMDAERQARQLYAVLCMTTADATLVKPR